MRLILPDLLSVNIFHQTHTMWVTPKLFDHMDTKYKHLQTLSWAKQTHAVTPLHALHWSIYNFEKRFDLHPDYVQILWTSELFWEKELGSCGLGCQTVQLALLKHLPKVVWRTTSCIGINSFILHFCCLWQLCRSSCNVYRKRTYAQKQSSDV